MYGHTVSREMSGTSDRAPTGVLYSGGGQSPLRIVGISDSVDASLPSRAGNRLNEEFAQLAAR